ncbi:hypothetical protein P154DRAFT_618160 [Amniculicola lignicola CBS 123094]|uniref:Mediator of RNA polymerase II transcription subunit 20 n=1 Tax=Amniculicola lignicola CBS 123094 TaxID=1392246 RepID=A0A6A5WSK6_9PLEO|nr:hypothetical protein P154DRAFT_618160 [Amniculicola lignicola CBS 123094]
MKYSGLYYIPATSPELSTALLNNLVSSLESHFAHPVRLGLWALHHRLLRSVPPPARSNAPPVHEPTSYIHILQLSYLSTARVHCYIQPSVHPAGSQTPLLKPDAGPPVQGQSGLPVPSQNIAPGSKGSGTMIAIPASQSEAHTGLLVNQFSPLWAFRHALSVQNGITFGIGQFTVHIGELRSLRGRDMATAPGVGVVVCITTNTSGQDVWASGVDEEGEDGYEELGGTGSGENGMAEVEEVVDFKDMQTDIRNVWGLVKDGVELGRGEVRDMMMAEETLPAGKGNEATVRMWCEVLRLRG